MGLFGDRENNLWAALDDGISFGHQCFSYKNWNTLV